METIKTTEIITYIINNNQAANKGYVDGNFVTRNCATFSGDVDIRLTKNKIVDHLSNKLYVDTNTVKLSSFYQRFW